METKTYFTEFPSPLGPVQLRGTAAALRSLFLAGKRSPPPLPADTRRDDVPLRPARKQVEEFLAGQRRCFSLPIEMQGSEFQLRVWQGLLAIPYGQTLSYGSLSKRIGLPTASRAVGSALGQNPLLIVVPCHRVLAASGALGGYSGGLAQKRLLLALEAHHSGASVSL